MLKKHWLCRYVQVSIPQKSSMVLHTEFQSQPLLFISCMILSKLFNMVRKCFLILQMAVMARVTTTATVYGVLILCQTPGNALDISTVICSFVLQIKKQGSETASGFFIIIKL